MYCKTCGAEMNENQDVCLKCGVRKGTGNAFCATCGSPVNPGATVCLHCGVEINKANKSYAGYDKIVMILVCLFLGSFGIHNFMLGENRKGVIKIVFTMFLGIGFIFAIIDLVKIINDTYVIEPDKYF